MKTTREHNPSMKSLFPQNKVLLHSWAVSLFLISSIFTIRLQAQEISLEYPAGTVLESSRVVAWGDDIAGQSTVPTGLSGVRAVAAGQYHSMALLHDGTVTAWGFNAGGQSTVPEGLSGVTAIAAGRSHSVALKQDGSLVAWGDHNPQWTVPDGLSGVTAIAVGDSHTIALKQDGSLVAWGDDSKGQSTIPAGLSGIRAIAAGSRHSVALRQDGTVIAWGDNDFGQSTVPAALSGVQAIAAGGYHTLALKLDGTVIGWGRNFGQITIPEGLTGVKNIAATDSNSAALRQDGTVAVWGEGSIYNGVKLIPPGLSGVHSIAAGGSHIAALKFSTADFGQQALGSTGAARNFFLKNTGGAAIEVASVVIEGADAGDFVLNTSGMDTSLPAGTGMTSFSISFAPAGTAAGMRKALLRITSNDPDEAGYLIELAGAVPNTAEISAFKGAGTIPADEIQSTASFVFPQAVISSTPLLQSFAIQNAGTTNPLGGLFWEITGPSAAEFTVASYAANDLVPGATASIPVTFAPSSTGAKSAQLRVYSSDADESPFLINLQGQGISREISLEYPIGTELKSSEVLVWGGDNGYGQNNVPRGLSGVRAVAAGGNHTVALRQDGTVMAWGVNSTVPEGLSGVLAIAAGNSHTLALRQDGTVVAWGGNEDGQSDIPGDLSGVQAIAAEGNHSLALKRDGTVVGWGDNSENQISIPEGLTGVVAIATGGTHSLALKQDGTVVAWGKNSQGQSTVPASLSAVQAIAAGYGHSLALKRDGTVVAWGQGRNLTGGFGDSGQSIVPAGLSGVQAIAAGYFSSVALKHDGTVVAWGYEHNTLPAGLTGVHSIAAGDFHHVALKASLVNFGHQALGTTGPARTFRLGNTGTAALHIPSIVIEGPNAADFSLNTIGTETELPALTGTTTFAVSFAPVGTSAGMRQAWLRITNDADVSSYVVSLSGNVPNKADIAVFKGSSTAAADEIQNAASLVFPIDVVPSNTPTSQSLTIQNAGNTHTLAEINLEITGPAARDFTLANYASPDLPPNATSSIGITFTPSSPGPKTAQLRIYSNDANENPFLINLQIMVIAPEISLEYPVGTVMESSRVVATEYAYEGTLKPFPSGLSGVRAIAAGIDHTLALKLDGSVVAWGSDNFGQSTVPAGLTGVRAIAAGSGRSAAIKQDGTVVIWGANGIGQNTVPEGITGVKDIALSDLYDLALKQDGTVTSWGYMPPVDPDGLSGVQAIAVGYTHNVALKQDGSLVAWGFDNRFGQTNIPEGLAGVQSIAAGRRHTVALKQDGTVVAWGMADGAYGRTGNVWVPPGITGIRAIATSNYHTFAVRQDGTVVSWTNNPTLAGIHNAVPAGLTGVQAIAAGRFHNASLIASTTNFGQQAPASSSTARTHRIRNTGLTPLHISSIIIEGADAGDFSINTTGMPTTLPAVTGTADFTISFTPTGSALGVKRARLIVTSDDLDEGMYDIALTGTVVPDQAPTAIGTIPTQTVLIGTPLTLDLASYFIDRFRGPLSYSVESNTAPGFITANLTQTALQLTGITVGSSTITIRVTHSRGLSTDFTFNVQAANSFPILVPPPVMAVSMPNQLADGSILLPMNVVPGRSYQIQQSTDLTNWTSAPIQAGADSLQWIDRSGGEKKFYRLVDLTPQ